MADVSRYRTGYDEGLKYSRSPGASLARGLLAPLDIGEGDDWRAGYQDGFNGRPFNPPQAKPEPQGASGSGADLGLGPFGGIIAIFAFVILPLGAVITWFIVFGPVITLSLAAIGILYFRSPFFRSLNGYTKGAIASFVLGAFISVPMIVQSYREGVRAQSAAGLGCFVLGVAVACWFLWKADRKWHRPLKNVGAVGSVIVFILMLLSGARISEIATMLRGIALYSFIGWGIYLTVRWAKNR